MNKFCEGDLVAVFGGELGKDSHLADTVTICKVRLVGLKDLIVENNTGYSNSFHTVAQAICFKLHLDPTKLSSSKTLKPQIGDLVVAFSRKYTSTEPERTSGILYKISYRLGKPDKCTLLCGTEMIDASWDELIVLRRERS